MEDSFVNRLKGDKVIWIIVLALSLISIAAVYSSSSSLAFREGKTTFSFLLKQMRFVIFGLTALYICLFKSSSWMVQKNIHPGNDCEHRLAYCNNSDGYYS